MSNCNCRTECTFLAVAAGIILGITTAILRFTAIITVTPAFLWVTLGIAVVYLALALLTAPYLRVGGTRSCLCTGLNSLLAGALGTILLSVVLLAITFAATSVLGAILSGALVGFLTLLLASTACLVKCVAQCSND